MRRRTGSARPGARGEALRAHDDLRRAGRATAARCGPATARRPAPPDGIGSRNAPDDGRADKPSEGHRQHLPHLDGEAVFRVLRADVGDGTTVKRPVVPVEWHRTGTPLLFKSIGPTARG